MSPYVKSLLQQVLFVFAFTFLSVFSLADLGTAREALIAGGVAALALVKGWLAKHVGDPNSADF
jgi:hypothetical protein